MLRAFLRTALLVLLAVAVLWIGLPPAAGWAVRSAAGAVGFQGTETEVTVSANPPLKLLLLEADSIRIRSRQVTLRTVHANDLDLTLVAVGLGQPIGQIEGRLSDVDLPDGGGATVHAQTIVLSGPPSALAVDAELSADDVRSTVSRALPAELGPLAETIGLAPPDVLRIRVAGRKVTARVAVGPDGALTLTLQAPGLPIVPLTLMQPDPGLPLVLQHVQISASGLELTGTLDARAWDL